MSSTVIVVLLSIIASLLYQLVRPQRRNLKSATAFGPVREENVFALDNDNDESFSGEIDLDVDFNYRPLVNHFFLKSRYDTHFGKSLYEYRIDGVKVFYRLVEDEHEDLGIQKQRQVRDGVVQESALRDWYKDWNWSWFNLNEKIDGLKRQVEWQELDSWGFNGIKYFILSKKLPNSEARRYLRQELERLKLGTAAFFKEAEKQGLEQDENSLDRFRVAEGKAKPTERQLKDLFESTNSLGITYLEFASGKSLTTQLEKLLGDNDRDAT